jgi:hypothetical protein
MLSLAISCGGGGSNSGSGGNTGNTASGVSGTWRGEVKSLDTGSTAPITLVLTQSGNSVSGTMDNISVNGYYDSIISILTLTLTPYTLDGISYTGTLVVTATGNTMSEGTISMRGTKDGKTVITILRFTASRQT